MPDVLNLLQEFAVTYGLKIIGAIVVLVVGRWVARLLSDTGKRLLKGAEVEETLVSFLSNILYYLLLVIVIIAALNILGIPTTSVVAVLGAATLAVGFALQDSLASLAAGVVIILLRPYKAGDFVEINSVTGYVKEVQIFHTRLTARDNRTVFIPNDDVMDGNIINYSMSDLVRVDLVFRIGYGDDIDRAKRILEEIVQANERVVEDPAPVVAVKALGDNSVNLVVRPFVNVKDMAPVTFEITEAAKLRFDESSIEMPYPQRDVHLFQANGN